MYDFCCMKLISLFIIHIFSFLISKYKYNMNSKVLLSISIIIVIAVLVSFKYIEYYNVNCSDSVKAKLEAQINAQTNTNYKYIYPQGSNTTYENPKSLPSYKFPWYPYSWKDNIPYEDIAHLDCNGSSNEMAWNACYNKLLRRHDMNDKDKMHNKRKQYMQRTNDLALGMEPFCCGM